MSKCINTTSAEFKSLTEMSGISSIELAAKMNLWMEDNNTDIWPTLEQLGIQYQKSNNFEILGEYFNYELGDGFILDVKYKNGVNDKIPTPNREENIKSRFEEQKNSLEKFIKSGGIEITGTLDENGNLSTPRGTTIYITRYGLKTLDEYRAYEVDKAKNQLAKITNEYNSGGSFGIPEYVEANDTQSISLNNDGSIAGSLGGPGIQLDQQLRGRGLGKELYETIAFYLKNKKNVLLKSDGLGHSEAAHRVWESLRKSGKARIIKGDSNEILNNFYTAQYEFVFPEDLEAKEISETEIKSETGLTKNGQKEYRFFIGDEWVKNKNEVRVVENEELGEYTIHEGDLSELSRNQKIKLFKAQDSVIPLDGKIVNHGKSSFDGIRHRLNLAKHGWKISQDKANYNQAFKSNNKEAIKEFAQKYNLGEVYQNNSKNEMPEGIMPGDFYIKGIVLERVKNTETIEDFYMANFDPDGEFNFSEYDDILKQIDQDESEFDLNEDIFSKDEKKEGLNLSFANLTKTLIYQHNDVKNELQNLYGQLNDAKAKDRPAIKSKIAKTNQKWQELVDKIKESKKLSNLEQLLQFGNDAINEVSQILSEGGLTDKQLNYLKRITDFWMRAGDFKSSQFDHILFGKDYETKINESIEDGLVAIAERMKKLDREVNSIGREFIVRMVKKQLGNTYTEADIYKAIKDINWGEANLFSISDYSSPLLSAVYAVMHDADKKAAWEFEGLIKQLDDKFKAADRHLSGKGNNKYNLFYQSHNGQLTGDLVGVYSKAYLDKKAELIEKAQRSKKPEDWKAFKDWSKENETYIDIRLLFPEGELSAEQTEVAKAHIKSIIDKIGQRQFDRIYRRLENAIEDYNYAKVQKMTTINSNLESTESQKWEELSAWEHRMSPYIELDRRLGVLNTDGTYGSTDVRFHNQVSYADKGIRGLRSIPKAKIDGKPSGWYDSKYEQISKNKELLDLYEYIQDTMDYMRSILPEHLRNHVGSNTMPMIMKSITELYRQNSAIGMANLWNSAQKSFVVNESSETEFDEIDVNTGVEVGGLKPRTFMHSNRIISERMKIKQSEFLAKNGVEPTKEDDINLRKEVIDQLNLERSFDLPKVMKIYIHSLISHKHKSNVDDLIKIARRELDSISEISVSEAGVDQFTPEGKLRTQVGLKRMKESLDYAIKAFEGGQLHTPEGRSSTKTLSRLEKRELAELLATKDKLRIQFDNGKINEAQLAKNNKIIDDKIAKLGGYVALSKIGDNLLKYTQLKGMGFNVIAGGVNLLTGWMENSIRAADGRWFNETQLNQSLRDAYTTIFDPTRKSKNTKKLISIEKRFHLVEDASQELYKEENRFGEIVYVIVKKTEFLNVMSMAGAFMRNIPVTSDKGEKSNLYEAFDENGNIKSGWKLSDTKSNEDFLLDVDLRMLKLKHKIHGNYGDRLKGKENILGRMAFQFRTWMPEMYNARFGKQGFDDILQKEVRGRWLSLGVLKGSEFEGNQFTAADNILYTLGQLGRKILFMRTSFDGRMSEMDAANMKANLMELHFMLGLMALMLILKAAVPDEEKKKNFSYNFLINMIIRQQNDIMVFANPMTFEQINKNVLPVMSILTDTDALITSVKNEFSDDDRKTGKSLGKLAKMLPLLGQAVRVVQYGEKQIAQQ